ncbi:MAG: dephospho-CoA kinase [Thiohalobacterales bacterium]|nr:dephospho-CoA kinase [Thiohalobacterales bacterium]
MRVSDKQPQAASPSRTRHPVIGLTGGIGSGKSTVAGCFAALGITVVDADQLARELVAPGKPAFRRIVATFGSQVVAADGSLDRAALRRRIYADPDDKQKLESILHPLIRARMQQLLAAAPGPYSIAVIPLLLETGQTDLVDRVLVVDASEALQRARVARRDGLSVSAISDIMASQVDRDTRLAAADDIISNDSDLDTLESRVSELHKDYLKLARARTNP